MLSQRSYPPQLYTTGTHSGCSNAGKRVGRYWVGVTRSMFSAPWAISSSMIFRRVAESTASPTACLLMTRFWQ